MDDIVPAFGILLLIGLLLPTVKVEPTQGSEGIVLDKDLGKKLSSNRELARQWLLMMGPKFLEEKVKNPPSEEVPESSSDIIESSPDTLFITERNYLNQGWCKMQALKQTIHEEGCKSYTFINRFCYGQCNSFYIPWHTSDERGVFQSCFFCKPKKVSTTTVILHCPDRLPPRRMKRIRQVEECRCTAIDVD
ncbi:gremlin-1-like [Sceloporus undulatus]|uniref:gremlin-1-like n=1 Tax=Sceloporus undulatus TaxID=8520 RepID=UPI001C4B3CFE|nr:gremlin-1-like [Sceloporus undulatus]